MGFKIKSKIISSALGGVKDLSKLDETQIRKIEKLSISGVLIGRRKRIFEKEINEVLRNLTKLKELEVTAVVKKGDFINIDLTSLNGENIEWLTLNSVDLSKTNFEEILKNNNVIKCLHLRNCNIRDVSFLEQISEKDIYIDLEENPISKDFARFILGLSQKTSSINMYNCEELLSEYERLESEGINIPRIFFR